MRWASKTRTQTHGHNAVKSSLVFKKKLVEDFSKVVYWLLKITLGLAYVATLPCETINDKLQGSVATYLRYGGVVNNHIKNGLLLSLPVKK